MKRKHLLFLLTLLSVTIVHAQYTQIPDPAFEQYLIDSAYDSEGVLDGQILTTDAQAITEVIVDGATYDVADFSGIEAFSSMINFQAIATSCSSIDFGTNNSLEIVLANFNLNLAAITTVGCTALKSCDISSNILSQFDVTQNELLENLIVGDNPITEIDVSNNHELLQLVCSFSDIVSLNLENTVNLVSFDARNTPIEYLDLRNGNNTNVTNYNTTNTPNLICVFVDGAAYSTANWTEVDPVTTFVETEAKCDDLGTEETTLSALTIHPNPARDFFYVDGLSEVTEVSLTNLRGQTVKVYGRSNTRFSVAGLSKGMYFLSIKSDDRTIQKRIIIH
ncbi:T9SS type A sorting domain-containing protein [Altibacter sp. HG106]|uniref:T9SS type A sorting domain-containing protein n=1 Tax=Altibacter sp. HG106 TaxID=3023937 RepID=UPI002350A431|nr:T9SS type A sorting domain-containing protein [Altibacter sp. HG106]MDC7995610.1 T9SS type A sorting domain-containing protein [Altibacter sp. HG106]